MKFLFRRTTRAVSCSKSISSIASAHSSVAVIYFRRVVTCGFNRSDLIEFQVHFNDITVANTSTSTTTLTTAAMPLHQRQWKGAVSTTSTASPTSTSSSNQGGVNASSNIAGIGGGFVAGALLLIITTFLARLIILRRRAREAGLQRPGLWEVFFDGNTNNRGADVWAGRGIGGWGASWAAGGGAWDLPTRIRRFEEDEAKEAPIMTEVRLIDLEGKTDRSEWVVSAYIFTLLVNLSTDHVSYQPTSLYIRNHPLLPESSPQITPQSLISSSILILLPSPTVPINPMNRTLNPVNRTTTHSQGEEKKDHPIHIEHSHSPSQPQTQAHPYPSTEEGEPQDLPDFVLGIYTGEIGSPSLSPSSHTPVDLPGIVEPAGTSVGTGVGSKRRGIRGLLGV